MIDTPGANSDRNEAVLENSGTTSDFDVAPTLTAVEMHAGELRAFANDSLPEATVVAMPTERKLSIAGLWGWASHTLVNCPVPRLRLAAAMV